MGFFSKVKDAVSGSAGSLLGSAISGGLGLIGTNSRNDSAMAIANMNAAMQKEFAQNSIKWRVEDAKRAGVHPMAALGINASSFSPVQPALQSPDFSFLSDMGQAIDRAAMVGKDRDAQAQAKAMQTKQNELALENMGLQNDLLRAEINSINARMVTAATPPAPKVNDDDPFSSGSPYLDKPIVRDGWLLDEKGRKIGIVPSEGAAQRFEDKALIEWIPFVGSSIRAFRGKFLGQKVNGHWWHGEDKGFLPYPPQRSKGFFDYASDVLDFYRDFDG